MPTSRTKAGVSKKYGSNASRRQGRRFRGGITGKIPLRLDIGFLQHLVDLRVCLLERVSRGHALKINVVKRARPNVAGSRAFRLRDPQHAGRLEVLRHGLDITAAAPRS